MPICPNCGSRKVLWGHSKVRERSANTNIEEQQNQANEQNQELSHEYLQHVTPSSIEFSSITEAPGDLEIRGSDTTLRLNSDGLQVSDGGGSDIVASLAICQDCGTVYNGMNADDAHDKVKENRKEQKQKDPKGRYRFIAKNEE